MEFWKWLRSKPKSFWREQLASRWINLTFWVQARGDRSLAVGLLSGVVIVLFFRLIFTALIVAAAVAALVYLTAPDE